MHEFNPDRFIDRDTYRWPRDACQFSMGLINFLMRVLVMAFSAGSRRCIGERFAVTEGVCLLAHLVRQYEILVPKDLRAKSLKDQKNTLLAFKPWMTTLPLNAKVVLKRRENT